jgi:hypothetical protein
VGVEVELDSGLRAMAYVYQPVYMDPVQYGPTLGLAVTIPLARDDTPASGPMVAPPSVGPIAGPPPLPPPSR